MRCVWQTRDLVDGSESAFSMDKLHHKDTVLVWDVSRRDFLCYSQAGPARVSNVLVLFLCLRISSLSPLFHLFVRLHPWLCVSVPLYVIFVCCGRNRISLCHVTAVSLFGAVLSCPVLLVAVQKVLTALQ